MGIKKFKIIFDNPVQTYKPGETVSGKILLDLDSNKKCRGMKVKISGKAFTRWIQPSGNGSKQIRGHETYFSSKFYVVGGQSDEMELTEGEHIFLFEYVLPTNLPTSYELKLVNNEAHVRYIVKAIIDRPWKFDNETEAPFTVVTEYDLNTDPIARGQVFIEETKTFGIFSSSPPLIVTLSLPFRGYVPGQIIPITVNVDNQSGVEVNHIKLKLEMYGTYLQSGSSSYPMKKKVNMSIIDTKKNKYEEDVFQFIHNFYIPPTPPSNIGMNCSIISIEYAIELEAEVDRMLSRNLKISTPIVIGTVPLENYLSSINSSLMTISPVYGKSMFVVENLWEENNSEYVMNKEKFAPKYLVYDFSTFQ
ncbi:arrestin domain-containing protein 17-like isoform X1 [Leptopilina heterotoma]|uniref:arrestin domain-containing protein 17-like isoform X1 n=3 Tax=Leptopilina heterotoma TaxID=63436 RepID=UPI001CA90FB8|nr:arrestin domain-containing protein 17-like isoform X1 [Leptopilina heterotoma]